MPVTKSAKKALRVSLRKKSVNNRVRRQWKSAVKALRENPTAQGLKKVFTELDRAAKRGVIHQNKAARLKSRLSKLLTVKPSVKKS